MQKCDFKRFSQCLAACAELYSKTLSEGAITLWWQVLERYEIEQVERAFRHCIECPDGGQWMPKPADLVKRLDGSAADRSLIAWGKVLDAMQRVGRYQSVAFDDGAIHAAIEDMGGWPNVCASKVADLPFLQRRFTSAHAAYSARPEFPYPAMLPGEHEMANRTLGNAVAPPVLIGDASKAKAVLPIGASGSKTQITRLADASAAVRRIGGGK
jgi:hypothetical protein